MKTTLKVSALLVAATLGCSGNPSPTAAQAIPVTAPDPLPRNLAVAAPAAVVYTVATDGERAVIAVAEDGSRGAVTLSRPAVDTGFGGLLPGRRVLLVEFGKSAIAQLVAISVDGKSRVGLGAPPAGRYQAAKRLIAGGDAIVVELVSAADPSLIDLYAFRPDGAPRLIASGARLEAVAAGRVAFLSDGNLRSARLDGGAPIALGGGDGKDQIAQIDGERIFLTAQGRPRAIDLDGGRRVDLDGEGSAFAMSATRLIVWRKTGRGAIFSTALDGSDERPLTATAARATPIALAPDGRLLFATAQNSLSIVAATGGAPQILDPSARMPITLAKFAGDRAVYTTPSDVALTLRAARLDGGGAVTLCEHAGWMPFVTALSPDGKRVLFQRALAGQPEGGQAFSVFLDGSELRPIGTDVYDLDGNGGPAPEDQDFEAVTPSGRVILETELLGIPGVQLLTTSADSAVGRQLSAHGSVRFAGLVP